MVTELDGMYVGATGDTYDEVKVLCEGALKSVTYWTDGANFDAWVGYWENVSRDGDVEIKIYILSHGHPLDIGDEECVCAQFATDHRPDYIFGRVA